MMSRRLLAEEVGLAPPQGQPRGQRPRLCHAMSCYAMLCYAILY